MRRRRKETRIKEDNKELPVVFNRLQFKKTTKRLDGYLLIKKGYAIPFVSAISIGVTTSKLLLCRVAAPQLPKLPLVDYSRIRDSGRHYLVARTGGERGAAIRNPEGSGSHAGK